MVAKEAKKAEGDTSKYIEVALFKMTMFFDKTRTVLLKIRYIIITM